MRGSSISEDDHSNYRFLRESLGEKARLYRVKTELSLREACEDFDGALEEAGAMDFTLLGMGEDGHVASIFPGRVCKSCGRNACTSASRWS
ncbi:MAG: 6-phosphogluconolactonase [Aquificota bacterium]|nr:6-phosphogluconolactonase [Aquificota bacterium]